LDVSRTPGMLRVFCQIFN